jgi:hypothetical protein
VILPFALVMLLAPQPKIDTCALLSDADVRAAVGEDVRSRTPATQPAGGLLMNQCVFATSGARSVSLAVTNSVVSGTSRVTPREFWKRQFHEAREGGGEHESGARRIRGVGEEAYWSGTRIAGALYVLKGDTFIRVSVGGIKTEPERVAKSKALATAALARIGDSPPLSRPRSRS